MRRLYACLTGSMLIRARLADVRFCIAQRRASKTLTRYAPILNRFVAFLPDIRRRFPLASITASDIDGKQDLAQQWRESRNAESECVTGQLEGSCDETQQAVLVQAELALE